MYTLLIDDNDNVKTTVSQTIMQRSSLVNNFQILTASMYRDSIDMTDAAVWMRYVLPVSKKEKLIQLEADSTDYNGTGYIQYIIPGSTMFTSEAGVIKLSFTFIKYITDDDGTVNAYVRKTQEGSVRITPVAQFENIDVDDLLDPIDQRLVELQAMVKDLDALNQEAYTNMVTDVKIDTDNQKVTLINNDGNVGDGIALTDLSDSIADYIAGDDTDGTEDGIIYVDDIPVTASTVSDIDNLT